MCYCDVVIRQGARGGRAGAVVDDHALHAVADGGDARDGAREASGPVPRARAGGVRAEAGAVGGGATTADCPGRRRHCVHGDGRQVAQQSLHTPVQGELPCKRPYHGMDRRLRVCALRPLAAPQLQLHRRRLLGRRRHVFEVLDPSDRRFTLTSVNALKFTTTPSQSC